jgi:hypothetical protein
MRKNRKRRLPAISGLALILLCSGLDARAEAPPAQDPEVVMAGIYNRALVADTNSALILFIARYPDHPLSDRAREELRARMAPDPVPPGGPDGRIIAAFDAARLDGSPGALDAFAAHYDGHPLAAEARRPIWRE